MFRKKSPVNQQGDQYVYVNPSMDNDITIRKINEWAELDYSVIAYTPGMILLQKNEVNKEAN